MRTMLVVFSLLFAATPALAEDCRYVAPNGQTASLEDGYLVIHIGKDDRYCSAEMGETDGVAECPTDTGDTREIEFSFDSAGMHFDDLLWVKSCSTHL